MVKKESFGLIVNKKQLKNMDIVVITSILENEENKTYQDDEKDESLVICGGGFPLIIQNELRGSILVSGLSMMKIIKSLLIV